MIAVKVQASLWGSFVLALCKGLSHNLSRLIYCFYFMDEETEGHKGEIIILKVMQLLTGEVGI